MNYRLMLLGSTANFAPETDEGADQNLGYGQDEGGDEDDQDDVGEDDEFEDPDDQEDDADDGDDSDPPRDEQRRQPTRGQSRFQRLSASAKAEKERADRLQAQLDAQARQSAQPQQTPEQIAAERERRLAGMTAEQRLEFMINEERQERRASQARIEFQTWDAGDKAAFAGLAAKNPAIAAIETEVEQRLTELRAGGQNASRETVAKYLLGEKALARAGRARTKGQRREQEGRERHEARPMNGRGDVPRGDQRRMTESQARRKRLEGMQI